MLRSYRVLVQAQRLLRQNNSEVWLRFADPLLTGGRTNAFPYLMYFHIFYLFRKRSTSCWSKNQSTYVVWKCCANHFAQHFDTTYVEQKVVQVTLINILEQHRVFAQHLGQMIGDVGRCWSICCSNRLDQPFRTTNVEWKPISHNICCADWNRMLIQTHSTFEHQVTQHMLCENAPNVVQSSLAQHFGTTYVDRFVDRTFSKG